MNVCEHCGRLIPHGCPGGRSCWSGSQNVLTRVTFRSIDALAAADHDDPFAELGCLPPGGDDDE